METLIVIIIIAVITKVMFNMRLIWTNNLDIRQEAVNTMYKETQLSLNDFNRNKIYISWDANYENVYFQLNFNDSGNIFSIENIYITSATDPINNKIKFIRHTEKTSLITWWKYHARNAIGWIEDYSFKVIKSWFDYNTALISKNWILESGTIITELSTNSNKYEIPNNIAEDSNECTEILSQCENNHRSELILTCLNKLKFYQKNCANILDFNTTTYLSTQWYTENIYLTFCAWLKNETDQPVWKMTINIAWKSATLDRCNNDRYHNWIDCWTICNK